MPERDADLVELGQHCRAIYTTDILGDPLHVLWASRFLRAAGSGDPGGERGAAGARPAAGDDRRRSKVMQEKTLKAVRVAATELAARIAAIRTDKWESGGKVYSSPKTMDTAAVRRQSMELTRLLADLRSGR